MSKRHPIKKEMPPVAKRRGKSRGPDRRDHRGRHGRDDRGDDSRGERRPPRRHGQRPTRVMTPVRWHPRGEATTEALDADPADRPTDIWQGIPGEEGLVERVYPGRNRVVARWVESRQPHPSRREPPCERYDLCGGCPLMHLEPAAQGDARLALLRDALQEVGLEQHAPTTIAPSPDGAEGYRHTVKLTVGRSDQGHLRVGTYSRNSHRVVTIPGCLVATETLRRVMSQVAFQVIDLDIWPYDPEQDRGTLRHIVLRQSRATGKVLVTVVAGNSTRTLRLFAENLAHACPEVSGVHLHLNDDVGNSIFQRDEQGEVGTQVMRGDPRIEEELLGLTLGVGPGDFYQANPAMAEVLVRDVVDAMVSDRDRPAVDLYCGVGGMSLALARAHGWAAGVEVIGGAVIRARENARRNRISAEFFAGEVADVLPELHSRLADAHPVVVVDPARRGLGSDVVDAITDLQPARLAYISCNPRALARDLADLVEQGWSIRQLRAYDMFPQTAHVEAFALMDPPREAPDSARRGPRRRIVR